MDDTIENLVDAWVAWLNKAHNLSVSVEDIKCWDIKMAFPSLSEEQIYTPLYITEFWKTVTPKPDAIKYVDQLVKDGHDVFICTSAHYQTIQPKMDEVLLKFFPCITWRNIITIHTKQMIKCDIMIDDGCHNLENGDYIKILFDAPWNRSYNETEQGMKRVKSWEEIYNTIKDLDWFYACKGLDTVDY